MFLQRFITSIILVPLVLLIIFFGHPWLLGALVLLIFLVAGGECLQLIPLKHLGKQLIFFAVLLLCLWGCGAIFSYWLAAGLILWGLNILAILTFPSSQKYWGHPAVVAAIFVIILPLFAQTLIQLYALTDGTLLIVYVLFLIWASDVGAYITGKLLGKNKLIPKVSPGKSWEGVAGGMALAMVVAWAGGVYFMPADKIHWFLLAFCTVIISIFGDLFVSILKRRCNLKDTGTLIPGHGGVLDRFDSLIAALPLFYFGLIWG